MRLLYFMFIFLPLFHLSTNNQPINKTRMWHNCDFYLHNAFFYVSFIHGLRKFVVKKSIFKFAKILRGPQIFLSKCYFGGQKKIKIFFKNTILRGSIVAFNNKISWGGAQWSAFSKKVKKFSIYLKFCTD
jgi:hypothetical protein